MQYPSDDRRINVASKQMKKRTERSIPVVVLQNGYHIILIALFF